MSDESVAHLDQVGESLTNTSCWSEHLPVSQAARRHGHKRLDAYVWEKPGKMGCVGTWLDVPRRNSWTAHVRIAVKADTVHLVYPRWDAARHN